MMKFNSVGKQVEDFGIIYYVNSKDDLENFKGKMVVIDGCKKKVKEASRWILESGEVTGKVKILVALGLVG